MDLYCCQECSYYYDPADGDPDGNVAAGTDFKKISHEWSCPDCGAPKSAFKRVDETEFEDEYDDDDDC